MCCVLAVHGQHAMQATADALGNPMTQTDVRSLHALQRYLKNKDAIDVTVVTDDPAPGAAALPPRTYKSLKAVTAEVGDSR
jgi:hypothetical protein